MVPWYVLKVFNGLARESGRLCNHLAHFTRYLMDAIIIEELQRKAKASVVTEWMAGILFFDAVSPNAI